MTEQTHYIRNEEGAVTSVTHDHFLNRLHTRTAAGNTYLRPGYKEVTEKEARAANPQLFGALDPRIVLTDDELSRALQRKKNLAELYGTTN